MQIDRNLEKLQKKESSPRKNRASAQAGNEESTSNTQKIDESSFDVSLKSSGVMLLEQIREIKRMFEVQGRELDNVGQAMAIPSGADRMKEIFQSIKVEPDVSLLNSGHATRSLVNFNEKSHLISPVANDFEGSLFASSLMSMSGYQVQGVEEH